MVGLLSKAQKIRDAQLLPYFPIGRWGQPDGELYGLSPEFETIRALNVHLKNVVRDQDWFKLVFKKPWWLWVLHPIRGRSIRKWMFEAEVVLKQEMENINFYERMKGVMVDAACYGTSPLEGVLKEFKLMKTAKMYQDIIKEKL